MLDKARVIDGSIRCPWHGYVFNLLDGRCQSQPALKLIE
ncbi:Rieske 2Fe-2S domain-containing protein [Altererythrobacter confluentis]|uniref:Rieske 2Fe-2S domain-containing protein n=1 Tax=Allopontixanthobacter confluentis TaxID=1849021 RepID=A0A6L7GEI6_9SPHN|nr:Rieske 2Fe-2S domain-containing protein [Allopontixanthobacter confluentis]